MRRASRALTSIILLREWLWPFNSSIWVNTFTWRWSARVIRCTAFGIVTKILLTKIRLRSSWHATSMLTECLRPWRLLFVGVGWMWRNTLSSIVLIAKGLWGMHWRSLIVICTMSTYIRFSIWTVIPRHRLVRRCLTNLWCIKFEHLQILWNDVHICLESLEGVNTTGLSGICLMFSLLYVRHNVCLSLDLVRECSKSFCIEADEMHFISLLQLWPNWVLVFFQMLHPWSDHTDASLHIRLLP